MCVILLFFKLNIILCAVNGHFPNNRACHVYFVSNPLKKGVLYAGFLFFLLFYFLFFLNNKFYKVSDIWLDKNTLMYLTWSFR